MNRNKVLFIYYFFGCLLTSSFNSQGMKSGAISLSVDTTINKQLILRNAKSIEKTIGDVMKRLDTNKDLPDVYFSNQSGSESLRLVFFPGDAKNEISIFEVMKSELVEHNKDRSATSYTSFLTENGIKVGMTKADVIKKKGKSFIESKDKNGFDVLRYTVDETNGREFLKRYNMSLYFAEYRFKDGVLIRFSFGFEYP